MSIQAYSPLEQGLLTGKYTVAALPADARREAAWFAPANVDAAQTVLATLRAIAGANGVEPATVALGWLLAKSPVVPLAGAKSAEQARQNAGALALRLDAAAVAELDAVSRPWCVAG